MATVAFLGLGKMGTGMALRLVEAGHHVRVYARDPRKAEPLVAAGAIACATPRAAADGAQAVFSMVSDDDASRAVWTGEHGALAATLAPRAFVVECSTLSRAWVLELASAAGKAGLRYIDAPVTGLPDAARAGELTLLVGADAADLRASGQLLSALATRILHFGGVGAGTSYKLVINMIGAVQIASLAEGLALAERAGLDLATVVAAVETSQAASPQVVRNAKRMLAGDHDQNIVFTPALRLKDVDYALRLAREAGLHTPLASATADLYRALLHIHPAAINESAIITLPRHNP